jgi:hypothetical protein
VQNLIEDSGDNLLNHIYKRRRLNADELDQYLETPIVSSETNILEWWKVYLNKILF